MVRWPPPDQIWCPALWEHRTWPHTGIGKSKSLPVPEGYHTLLVFSLLPNGGMLRNQFPDLFSVHISLGNFTEAHGLKTICWNHTLKCLLHISMLVSYSQNYYPPEKYFSVLSSKPTPQVYPFSKRNYNSQSGAALVCPLPKLGSFLMFSLSNTTSTYRSILSPLTLKHIQNPTASQDFLPLMPLTKPLSLAWTMAVVSEMISLQPS